MKEILDAILARDTPAEGFAALPVPQSYLAVTVHRDEQEMFAGMQSADNVELSDRFGIARGCCVPHFFQRHCVSAGRIFLATKSAQTARRHADIGVVNVPVDVEVGNVAVHPFAHVIRQPTDCQNVA